MSKLSKTIMLITEKVPNIRRPKNLVNSLMPVNSKLSKSIRPKIAQKRVWEVSHRLQKRSEFWVAFNTDPENEYHNPMKWGLSKRVVPFFKVLLVSWAISMFLTSFRSFKKVLRVSIGKKSAKIQFIKLWKWSHPPGIEPRPPAQGIWWAKLQNSFQISSFDSL